MFFSDSCIVLKKIKLKTQKEFTCQTEKENSIEDGDIDLSQKKRSAIFLDSDPFPKQLTRGKRSFFIVRKYFSSPFFLKIKKVSNRNDWSVFSIIKKCK